MFPEDRVLVGVINRKRDLKILQEQHWYRIPQKRQLRGVDAEYIAFFLSGKVFKEQSGGIHYYARVRGVELLYRRDLLPKQADHARADDIYYKVMVEPIHPKDPPVQNTSKRTIAFIRTTWDRFSRAKNVTDLYSTDDYFVDRIYHALRSRGIRSERYWETEADQYDYAPAVRVICQQGEFTASTRKDKGNVLLDSEQHEDAILQEILDRIDRMGGPATLSIPFD